MTDDYPEERYGYENPFERDNWIRLKDILRAIVKMIFGLPS